MSSVPFLEQAALSGFQQGSARKDQLADEERQMKAGPLIETSKALIAKLPNLTGPDLDAAKQQLAETQAAFDELYHPIKAPGAIQRDAHFLLSKIKSIHAPKDNTPTSTTTQTPAFTLPNTPAPLTTTAIPETQQTTMRLPSQGGPVTTTVPGVPSQTLPPMQAAPAPLLVTQSFGNDPVPGMTAKGNADLSKTDNIDNGDGTHSSTFSMSFGTDKGEVLVPGVGDGKTYPKRQLRVLYTLPDGSQKWAVPGNQPHNWIAPERPTPQNNEALNQYQKTGKNFGTFEDEKAADAYGKALHEDQEKYGQNGVTAHPVSQSGNITIPAGPPVTVKKATWAQGQVQKLKDQAMAKAQGEAKLLAAGAPMSPSQQAMIDFRSQDAVTDARIASTLNRARDLGLPEEQISELKQQLLGMKNITFKPLTGAAGVPTKGPDGLFYQAGSDANGNVVTRPMPPGWKPNTKAVAGSIVNTKEHGWIKTWVNPYNPSQIMGFQKITPGRQYAGSTSSSTSTDAFGLTTTSNRSTMPTTSAPVDMDFSGMQELPENYNGEEITPQTSTGTTAPSGSPNKSPAPTATPPKSVTTPAGSRPTPTDLKKQVPAPPAQGASLSLDSAGHIPATAPYNKYLIGAANDILDGKDIDKMPIPLKDKEAAENIARQYGWGGQGMFNPQQKLQIREASTFLNDAINNKSLSVLDDWESRQKLISYLNNSEGHGGFVDATVARNLNLSPKEAEFLRMYRQLTGTISGLASLTRPGRPTEAGIKRLMFELPNPNESHSASDAKARLKRLTKEIEIATKKGNADDLLGGAASSSTNNSGALTADQFRQKYLSPPPAQ